MLKVVNPSDSKHFRDRLFQRYGILLTASEMWDLRDRLKLAKILKKENDMTTYLMSINSKQVLVVYSNKAQRFITAKPISEIQTMRIHNDYS